MKPGDMVRNLPWKENGVDIVVFIEADGPWRGIVLLNEPPRRPSKYNEVHILLTSHGGVLGKAWLTPEEIEKYVEVLT